MAVVRASLDLDPSQLDAVESAAVWHALSVQEFLDDCLQSGIAHARALIDAEIEELERESKMRPEGEDDFPF